MLTILWGRSGSGKTTAILEDITLRAGRGETGLIWLTPEPFSHECERMLAERGGPSVCLSAEVLTFKRLADRVFTEEGAVGAPSLDEGGRLLAMRLAADLAERDLELWRGAARKAEFLRRLLSTLDQCKCYGITPPQLLEAAGATDGHATRKLTELSLIFAAYDGITAGLDPRDRMDILRDRLEDSGYLRGKRLYVDGYVTFTPLEHRVLDVCVRRAEHVILALTGTPGDAFFRVPAQTAARLRRGLNPQDVREIVLPGSHRAMLEPLRILERALTESPPPKSQTLEPEMPPQQSALHCPPSAVGTAFCASPGAELQYAAEAIHRWTQEGLRYRDIAVVLPTAGPYEALAEAVLDKHGIPVFTDRLDDVRSKPLARLLRAACDVLEHGWRVPDAVELLRTGLTRVPMDAADELENYIRLWGFSSRHWTDSEPWTLPPRGYGAPPENGDTALLRRVNRARVLLSAPLKHLSGGRTAADWAKRTARFLEDCRTPRALKRRSKLLDTLGERKLSEESRQLWGLLVRALEQCAAVLQDRPMARAEFFDLLLLTLSAYGVGSIPASLDRVTVGTAGRLRRLRVRAAVLPGCRAALMPRFDEPDSLLSTEEIAALESTGAELPPDSEDRLSRALFDLYMAAALPSERLLLSYSPEENGRKAPAALFETACALPGAEVVEPVIPLPPEADWPHLHEPLDTDAVESLYGRDVYLSASRLKLFSECRQAFFLRYGLRAQPRLTQGYTAMDRGSFVHEVLERVGRHFAGRDARDIPDAELRAAALSYAESYAETALQGFAGQSRRFEQSFAALTAAALEAVDDVFSELRRSRFQPVAYELAFGGRSRGDEMTSPQNLPAVPAGHIGRFSIKAGGKVDRVDIWRAPDGKLYVRAVDYKTGAAAFDYASVLQGGAVQLPLYLAALTDMPEAAALFGGKADTRETVSPAGFLYIPAGAGHTRHDRRPTPEERSKSRKSAKKRRGLLLENPEVLRAMEETDGGFDYLPVRLKKDGSPYAGAPTLSAGQMDALGRRVREGLRQSAEALTQGDVSAAPLSSAAGVPCERCDYHDCCYHDEDRDGVRTMEKMDRERFLEELENEE